MSLRLRVVLLIGLVMFASMVMGAIAAGYQVSRVLDAELRAGLDGARQTAESAFEDLPHSDHPARDLRQLVATFNGNRHVRAALIDRTGHEIAISHTPIEPAAPPKWFRSMLGTPPGAITLEVPTVGAQEQVLILRPTADLDEQAAW